MKTKDKKKLQQKDIQELKNELVSSQKELFNLRMQLVQFKLKNTSLVAQKRKDIARMLTVMREKEINNEKNI